MVSCRGCAASATISPSVEIWSSPGISLVHVGTEKGAGGVETSSPSRSSPDTSLVTFCSSSGGIESSGRFARCKALASLPWMSCNFSVSALLLSVWTAVDIRRMLVEGMLDMDWLTEEKVEELADDVIGTSGNRKLPGSSRVPGGSTGAGGSWLFSGTGFLMNACCSLSSCRSGCSSRGGWVAWTGGTRGGGTLGVAVVFWNGGITSSGGVAGIGFSSKKHTTVAWPPLAASITMLDPSWEHKTKCHEI